METSSTFYNHMRQSYAGDHPVPNQHASTYGSQVNGSVGGGGGGGPLMSSGGPLAVNDIRQRLNQIVSHSGQQLSPGHAAATIRPGNPTTPGSAPRAGIASAMSASPIPAVGQTTTTAGQHPAVVAAQQQQAVHQAAATAQAMEEDILTTAEMECLKIIELDGFVSVYASVPSAANPGSAPQQLPASTSLQLLCDQAIVKVFPRHVVVSRSVNGSPVVELVIQELSELAEDAPRQALTFVLAKPGGNATVELTSSRPQVLSTLYKLVCMKRNLIEAGGQQPKQ